MGSVLVGVKVEYEKVELKMACEKASTSELSLALAHLEIAKQDIIAQIRKQATETRKEE